jgi:hypothetical protein
MVTGITGEKHAREPEPEKEEEGQPEVESAGGGDEEEEEASSSGEEGSVSYPGWVSMSSVNVSGQRYVVGDAAVTARRSRLGLGRVALIKGLWMFEDDKRRVAEVQWYYRPEDVPYDGSTFLDREIFLSNDRDDQFSVEEFTALATVKDWSEFQVAATRARVDRGGGGTSRPKRSRGDHIYVCGRFTYRAASRTLRSRQSTLKVPPRNEERTYIDVDKDGEAGTCKIINDDADGDEDYHEGDPDPVVDNSGGGEDGAEEEEEEEEGDETSSEEDEDEDGDGDQTTLAPDPQEREDFVALISSMRNTKLLRHIEATIIRPAIWRGHSSPENMARNRAFEAAVNEDAWAACTIGNQGYKDKCDGCGMLRMITQHRTDKDTKGLIKLGSECGAVYDSLARLIEFINKYRGQRKTVNVTDDAVVDGLYEEFNTLKAAVVAARRMQ